MCVGTGSHAGKSVLAAALCRIYARRGYRVAPFKAQNMALNSFVTPEGGELGRAQAYQARAAGVEPHVDMNPVLLKPSSQTGSQVIVLGRPVRHMSVREYHAYQPEVWPVVTAAYERLRAANDLIVIEGAGSPAEINLRDQDIVNMKVALYAQCPVLLIGDIDRGGVFASLVGHMELFTPEERERIAAFVINKFRGDASLLDSGLEFLRGADRRADPGRGADAHRLARRRGGLPRHRGPAAPGEAGRAAADRRRAAAVHQQLHRLRRPGRRAGRERALRDDARRAGGRRGDRAARHQEHDRRSASGCATSGMAAAVLARAAAGTPVIGVCGGYQMLGRRIHDPEHVESDAGTVDGLGLLDVETTFAGDKRTVRVEGELLSGAGRLRVRPGSPLGPASPLGSAGTPLHGYEIHMGRTTLGPGAAPLLRLRGADGSAHEDGAVSAGPASSAGPAGRPSAAATSTASSTTRRCAARSSTGCAPPATCRCAARRPRRRTTTSTASPTTSRPTWTPRSSNASSAWRHDDRPHRHSAHRCDRHPWG